METLLQHSWIIIVILAQFTWACGNYIDGWLLRRYRVEEVSATGTLILISAFFSAVVAILIAIVAFSLPYFGYLSDTSILMPKNYIALAMLVGVMEIAWLIPYLYALDESDEAESAPLFQLVPIFGLVLGITIFNEIPLPWHIVGTVVVVIGALILNMNLSTKKLNRKVIFLMLLASLIIATLSFIFKHSALAENFWGISFWMSVGMALTGVVIWILVPLYRRQFNTFLKTSDWKGYAVNAGNEMVDNLGIFGFNAAVMLGPSVATVQSTTAYQPVFIMLIGLILAKNGSDFHALRMKGKELTKKVIGIILIVGGSILIFF